VVFGIVGECGNGAELAVRSERSCERNECTARDSLRGGRNAFVEDERHNGLTEPVSETSDGVQESWAIEFGAQGAQVYIECARETFIFGPPHFLHDLAASDRGARFGQVPRECQILCWSAAPDEYRPAQCGHRS